VIKLTEKAIEKILEVLSQQNPKPAGLRIGIKGGGCSGYQYNLEFSDGETQNDKVFEFGELKVFVDQVSLMYLDGATIDYEETLHGAGFRFDNPNVKTQCGCGQSFTTQDN